MDGTGREFPDASHAAKPCPKQPAGFQITKINMSNGKSMCKVLFGNKMFLQQTTTKKIHVENLKKNENI